MKQVKKREAKLNFDDRNWREKELKEMKDRDWRIFREDFNISTKGGQIAHPLRSWKESTIPSEIREVISKVGYKVCRISSTYSLHLALPLCYGLYALKCLN